MHLDRILGLNVTSLEQRQVLGVDVGGCAAEEVSELSFALPPSAAKVGEGSHKHVLSDGHPTNQPPTTDSSNTCSTSPMAGGSTPSRRFGHSTTGFNRPKPTARHVWVGTQPAPGVLVAWRKEKDQWQAQVVYVDTGRVIVAWLPADMVRPA